MGRVTEEINGELEGNQKSISALLNSFNEIVKNISNAPSSEIRLENFKNLEAKIQSLQGPMATLNEQISNSKPTLLAVQYDGMQTAMTEEKSRLADLSVRVENRIAQLEDVIKEKTEFEIKLNNFQVQVIDIETELESAINSNTEIQAIRNQAAAASEMKNSLYNIRAEFNDL